MSDTVIKVQNLSKRYRLGMKEERHDTFTGQMMAMLKAPVRNFRQLRGLSKFKGEDESVFWALRDINFEVKQGEVLGIIGHNGAGKSTLLKILSHITEPTTGEVHLKGRVSALLEVGTGFHPELTGRENIYMNGTILGMTKKEIDRKLDEIVDFSGVEKHIDTPVKFYSSGMKVRLGFSVAAHLEPEILIIDEVLAVGDAEFQKKCLGKMEDITSQDGRTILFVSHNMDGIKSICHEGILLKGGNLQLKGSISQVVNEYLNNNTQILTFVDDAPSQHPKISKISIDHHDLDIGKLKFKIEFNSPFEIYEPIVGIVIYNAIGVPIIGSNTRFHPYINKKNNIRVGQIIGEIEDFYLHSGTYKISAWLGDTYHNFQTLKDVIVFEHLSKRYTNRIPDPINIGSLDKKVNWTID